MTGTSDSGAGSLRSAIEQLDNDSSSGIDSIHFAISSGGLQVIVPLSGLPGVTHPVVIDGTTQSPGSATPPIEIYGGLLSSNPAGGGGGLAILADDSTVRGLVIDGFGNSKGYGIDLSGTADSVVGCFIGINADGTAAVPNTVGIIGGATIGGITAADRNLISGNGVGLPPVASLIEGNDIGTDVTGLKSVPNLTGVEADGNNTLGGTTSGMGNLISGNSGDGIYSDGDANLIEGNWIGIASDGNPLGNAHDGIAVTFGSLSSVVPNGEAAFVNATIGGTVAGAGNIIADNGGSGVNLVSSSINGSLTGPDQVTVRGNSIHGNGGIGIDFNGQGSLPNLGLASAVGPNQLQNHPDLTSATISGGMTTLGGSLVGTAGTTYQLDF